MNRIDETFERLKNEKKKAFIAYIAAGDPDMYASLRIAKALALSGADIIELGIPFSDPLADGPTIQKAVERSLKAGCTVKKIFDLVKSLRKAADIPIVFMTYYNVVYSYGLDRFSKAARAAGADGLIVPDLPMEEAGALRGALKKEGLHLVMLTSPTTPPDRFKRIACVSSGFIYHVSLTGVTGVRKSLAKGLEEDVRRLKKLVSKPLCVGFGVSDPHQAKDLARAADGVIVGSAIVKIIEKNLKNKKTVHKKIAEFAGGIARAVHGV
jgi:tryptophan synthase alpha chain